ncbi:MAG TPA: TetR/AcrR family transcriptional regulator [Mucilaginibacter sp.]|jgi:AcrR family transcriptional regulator
MTSSLQTSDDITQQEILQAALGLYRKFGPDKVTMDDVAAAAGRSRSSLYYYYKNRDEVFQAVLDTIVDEMAKAIRRAVANADTLNDKLYAFCFAKIKTSEDWKSILNKMLSSMDDNDGKSRHAKMMGALHKKLLYQESIILTETLSAEMSQKQMRPINAMEQDMLSFLISCSIRGIRNEIYNQQDPHDIKAAVRVLTDVVAKWLKD